MLVVLSGGPVLSAACRLAGQHCCQKVELMGLEPTTSCMPCKRSSQLSYSPVRDLVYQIKRHPHRRIPVHLRIQIENPTTDVDS